MLRDLTNLSRRLKLSEKLEKVNIFSQKLITISKLTDCSTSVGNFETSPFVIKVTSLVSQQSSVFGLIIISRDYVQKQNISSYHIIVSVIGSIQFE